MQGKKTGGRKKGVPNRVSALAREGIAAAAKDLGGPKRLAAWAKEKPENETAFWTKIYPRLLPIEVEGSGGGPLVVEIVRFADQASS